ncbi:hypothetical protein BC2230_70266 [Burkholderia cepacia]
MHVRFAREREGEDNWGYRVDIRQPKRLAALCISTVSISARLADESLLARNAGAVAPPGFPPLLGGFSPTWISCVPDRSKRCDGEHQRSTGR